MSSVIVIIIQWKLKGTVSLAGFAACHRLAHSLIAILPQKLEKGGKNSLNFHFSVHFTGTRRIKTSPYSFTSESVQTYLFRHSASDAGVGENS